MLKKVSWKDAFYGAVIFLIIATVIHLVESMLTMGYYTNPEYFGLWSKLMMPSAGPPPPAFMLISALINFIAGFVIAVLYQLVKDEMGNKYWTKVSNFAAFAWILATVLFAGTAFLLFNLPLGLLGAWLVSSAFIYFLTSLYLARK
jgi:hypothetical protein